ncbi:hypothetical protein, partial [Streptomyces sp. NPDC031705]|uniref:hypothetical protein n=1 Tax=Streptomyces sp. NPDC031705 TaxID=3155729 RepID=UPI0033F6B847
MASPGYDVLVLGEVLVEIHAGTALRSAADGTAARISYYPGLADDVSAGERILVDDGRVTLEVT